VIEAREATGEEMGTVAAAMARAFRDDPVMLWLFGARERSRLWHLRRFFRFEGRRHSTRGIVLTTPGLHGGAFWDPPDVGAPGWLDMVRAAPVMVPAIGPRIRRALRGLEAIERARPRTPHWYLAILGTDPAHQGAGVGRALVHPVLARCDREGLGAYLESSKESNIPWYERCGFVVTGHIDLPGGPQIYPMWRDPR
jgi:GNAT superfamily N-acetyltransferase